MAITADGILCPGPDRARPRPRPPVLEVERLSAFYGAWQALNDLSLDLFPQEILGIMGPSGSGRTTLLRCLSRPVAAGGDPRRQGAIRFRGTDIARHRHGPAAFRRRFGWVGQRAPLPPGSLFDLVASRMPAALLRRGGPELSRRVEDCLKRALLDDLAPGCPRQVSVTRLTLGQLVLLDIARALAAEPEVMLVDLRAAEAAGPLPLAVDEALLGLRRSLPVVLVSDDAGRVGRLADRVALLSRGRLTEIGPPLSVLHGAAALRLRA